VRQTN